MEREGGGDNDLKKKKTIKSINGHEEFRVLFAISTEAHRNKANMSE